MFLKLMESALLLVGDPFANCAGVNTILSALQLRAMSSSVIPAAIPPKVGSISLFAA